jgi:hypothetical protein
MTNIYGRRSMAAYEQSTFIIYDAYDMNLETWQQVTGLTGLLAISVSVAGALLWERETRPQAKRASILGLNETAAGRMVRAAAPQRKAVAAKAHVDRTVASLPEEESLTPLERVIRGY